MASATLAILHAADLSRDLSRLDAVTTWTSVATEESEGLARHFTKAALTTYAKLQAEMVALGLIPTPPSNEGVSQPQSMIMVGG